MAIDPATHALRDDLADIELADRVFAPHYARAKPYRAVIAASMHMVPSSDSAAVSLIPAGAAFQVLDLNAGWVWGKTDDAVGYILQSAIEPL